ncbi:HD domain-containing protein [bacterium]|nr:HD domain-containing protein [bacterium]MBU1025303.1 HD domain-containing protein [bacterium]
MKKQISDLCRQFQEDGVALSLLEHELSSELEDFWLAHIQHCEECMAVLADVLYAESQVKNLSLAINMLNIDKEQTKSDYFALDEIELESELKEDLFSGNNELLLAKGTLITPAIKDILLARGIEQVRYRKTDCARVPDLIKEEIVENDSETEILAAPEENQTTYKKTSRQVAPLKDLPEGFFFVNETAKEQCFEKKEFVSLVGQISHREAIQSDTKQRAVYTLQKAISSLQQGIAVDLEPVREVARSVVDEMLKDESKTLSLMDLLLFNNEIYTHSFNTLVIFTTLARSLSFDKDDLLAAGEAVLMHDIGRILPESRIQEDKNAYRNHPLTGYRHLMKQGGFNENMLPMVLNHHERYDGKGFPRSIPGTKLSILDQVLIVSNFYDESVTDTVHNVKKDFHNAAQIIYQSPNIIVSSEITNAFLNIFGIFPPGTYVKLRSGEEGIVREANYQRPFQPLITLLKDKKGLSLPEPLDIDLRELEHSSIEKAIDLAPLLESQRA